MYGATPERLAVRCAHMQPADMASLVGVMGAPDYDAVLAGLVDEASGLPQILKNAALHAPTLLDEEDDWESASARPKAAGRDADADADTYSAGRGSESSRPAEATETSATSGEEGGAVVNRNRAVPRESLARPGSGFDVWDGTLKLCSACVYGRGWLLARCERGWVWHLQMCKCALLVSRV
jgi:hypothetical protein